MAGTSTVLLLLFTYAEAWSFSPPPPPPLPPPSLFDDQAVALLLAALAVLATMLGMWFVTAPQPVAAGKISRIIIYPLKSARGVSVESAALDSRGLVFDRLWMVVDENGSFMSQRRAPRLALVEAALPTSHDEPLRLAAKGAKPISVPVVREGASSRVRCWDDNMDAVDQGEEAAAWLAAVLGVEGVRLVRMAESTRRACSRKYAPRGSTTAFSDGFPLLLANESSLAQLNEKLAARGKLPVPMNRFRPNLVLDGTGAASPPFAEDGWERIRVHGADAAAAATGAGGVGFGVVKPCARCKMPTIDQDTGVPDQRASAAATSGADDDDEGGGPAAQAEPTATLRTFRTGAGLGYKKRAWAKDVFFGQNLVLHARAGAVVSVGDAVVATPRRKPGWLARGVPGVDF